MRTCKEYIAAVKLAAKIGFTVKEYIDAVENFGKALRLKKTERKEMNLQNM